MRSLFDILLVDDNPADAEIFQEALREIAPLARAQWVSSGEDALEFLKQRGRFKGLGPVKLVVLDLNMTGMDGFETLQKIRHAPELSRVPVVLFSSSRASSEIDKSYSLGANSFFSKPNSLPGYVEHVRIMVQYWLQFAKLPSPLRPLN